MLDNNYDKQMDGTFDEGQKLDNGHQSNSEQIESDLSTENVQRNEIGNAIKKTKINKFRRRKQIRAIFSKTISVVAWFVGICLMCLCLSSLYQQVLNPSGYTGFFGIGEAKVASDSMAPTLLVNDLIFYKEVALDDIAINDIVVYKKTDASTGTEMLIVHQVVNIVDGVVTTQGINNTFPDKAFPASDIVGKYMFKISYIGQLLDAMSTKMAPVMMILAVALIMIIRIVAYSFHKKRTVAKISTNIDNRAAIAHFFDL